MSYVRCSHCSARRTLTKPLAHYYRPPPCRRCGRKKYRVDKYRTTVERNPKVRPCMCHKVGKGFYWFPHRKGSLLCHYNPKLTTEIAEKWAKDRGLI